MGVIEIFINFESYEIRTTNHLYLKSFKDLNISTILNSLNKNY